MTSSFQNSSPQKKKKQKNSSPPDPSLHTWERAQLPQLLVSVAVKKINGNNLNLLGSIFHPGILDYGVSES